METGLKILGVIISAKCIAEAMKMKKRKHRRWWVCPAYQRRRELGEFDNLLQHLSVKDPEMHFKYLRMSPERYDHLLSLVSNHLAKSSLREPVSPSERLTITLVYLATGCSQQDLSFRFHRGRSTISNIVRETCEVIWKKLSPVYLHMPENENEWRQVAQQFQERWNFPHCLGSIDGKHFHIQCPKLSDSQYYNYKQHFSSLVLAMCDAEYKFTYVNIGSAGREGDAGVFSRSDLFQCLEREQLNVPYPAPLPGFDTPLPYVIIGDEAFPLKPYLIRPYPGRGRVLLPFKEQVYNYRLSRARRCIENAFGILVARWRIFRTPIIANIDNVERFIKAAVVLHNYLITMEADSKMSKRYVPANFADSEDAEGLLRPGSWRNEATGSCVTNMGRIGSNMSAKSLNVLRDNFSDYFVSPAGTLPWQHKVIH